MNKRTWFWLTIAFGVALVLAALLATTLAAQSPESAPAQKLSNHKPAEDKKEPPVLRVATRLVQVSVVVHDKKGVPVSGLTQADFEVFDGGHAQAIEIFSVETNRAPAALPAPLPPDTFTNRLQQREAAPSSVTVILLDGLNTAFGDQAYARDELIKFLAQLQPQDRVAIYTLGAHLRVLHDFSSDSSSLVRAIQSYRGRQTPELDASQPEYSNTALVQLDAFLNDADAGQAEFFMSNRVRVTLGALVAIAEHLAGLPGRKNLIWLSGSFPVQFSGEFLHPRASEDHLYGGAIENAARALSDASLAVYPVDARGLVGVDLNLPYFPLAGFGGSTTPAAGGAMSYAGSSPENLMTMDLLADRTGGTAAYNTNDIKTAIRRAIEDSSVTYVLGYYPQIKKWDGSFHSIKVKVDREGAKVRARRGYFALPDAQLLPKQREDLLKEAAQSPLDATAIPLTVHLTPSAVASSSLSARIMFDPRDIRFEGQADGHRNATVDFFIAQHDAQGRILDSVNDTADLKLSPETYAKVMAEGLTYSKTVALVPNAVELRVLMRDAASGAIGSVSIPLSNLLRSPAR